MKARTVSFTCSRNLTWPAAISSRNHRDLVVARDVRPRAMRKLARALRRQDDERESVSFFGEAILYRNACHWLSLSPGIVPDRFQQPQQLTACVHTTLVPPDSKGKRAARAPGQGL
jgi:hypothetical protein